MFGLTVIIVELLIGLIISIVLNLVQFKNSYNMKKKLKPLSRDFNEENIRLETKKNKEICIERDKISSIKLSLF